jgi:hypothetical protein
MRGKWLLERAERGTPKALLRSTQELYQEKAMVICFARL